MQSNFSRRQFLTTLGAGVVASRIIPLQACSPISFNSAFNGETLEYWIDRRFTKFKTPWRKVHLDFHNSKYVPRIGADFNAQTWGDQLVAGNVDSIVVFAKDMHGYFYYPSQYGPVHPSLSFDLLGEQVKACRERDIAVYAYYCTAWDHYLADKHPEWNMRKRDGSDYRPKAGEIPGWTALCLGNKGFVDLMAEHIREFVSGYDLDGAWLDMAEPRVPECYCPECVRQIKAAGKDPFDQKVQREHQNKNFIEFHRRMKELVHGIKPSCQVDFNDIGIGQVSERAEFLDNIDIEALPTGGWGYFYAPAQVRYQRNFGIPVYGMTGRFVSSWADFGGLKLDQQLDVELASLVANAARCDVGDQMPPNGQLDAAVYHVLGKSFGRIKKLEPWLDQAAPVTEAALMIPSVAMGIVNQPFIYGLVKLMIESHLQFDLLEQDQEWERYNLVVIPDELMPDSKTIERLHQYIEKGGSVIVCHNGGLQAETKQSWLDRYGMKFEGQSPFNPAYFVADSNFVKDMPGYAYALYDGASQWKIQAPARSLAQLGEPLFQRSPEHYTSHRQSPFDHITDYSVLAMSGKLGLIGFPVGNGYYGKGYWIYREAFIHLVNEFIPKKLVETNAPLSTEVTVAYQEANEAFSRPERYMVHLINWSPVRKTPQHPEMHEDVIPLTNIQVKLNIPLLNVAAKTAVSGEKLKHRLVDHGIEVTVPKIPAHEVVCFEIS
jgi:hypothetical protein